MSKYIDEVIDIEELELEEDELQARRIEEEFEYINRLADSYPRDEKAEGALRALEALP